MNAPHASGTFYIAPAGDPRNEYAAGYDGNVFATRAEAEAEIPHLTAALAQFADAEDVAAMRWTVEVRS